MKFFEPRCESTPPDANLDLSDGAPIATGDSGLQALGVDSNYAVVILFLFCIAASIAMGTGPGIRLHRLDRNAQFLLRTSTDRNCLDRNLPPGRDLRTDGVGYDSRVASVVQ